MSESFQHTVDLLRAARQGDEASRRALLTRHEKKIRAMIRNQMGTKLRSREETADLVQDVLLGLMKDLDPTMLESEEDFDRFIAGVVRNQVAYRGRKRGEESGGDERGVEVHSAPFARVETEVFDRAARNEHRERLRRAVDKLSEPQQRVVRLRDFEEQPFSAVAIALGKSEEAVQMLHHRAWVRLTIMLREIEPNDGAG